MQIQQNFIRFETIFSIIIRTFIEFFFEKLNFNHFDVDHNIFIIFANFKNFIIIT